MKIESIIKRKGGSIVDMDAPKRSYHFKPEDGKEHLDPHVADVEEESHVRALLRIREGYRVAEGEEEPEYTVAGQIPNDQELTGSTVHNASYPISGGENIELKDLVQMAFEDSGLTFEEWEELADQERYDYIDATLRELQAGEGHTNNQTPEQQNAPQPQPDPQNGPTSFNPTHEPNPDDQKHDDGQGKAGQQQGNPSAPVGELGGGTGQAPQVDNKPAGDAPTEDMTRAQLADLFKKRFGRDPSRQMNKAEIIAAISEEDED